MARRLRFLNLLWLCVFYCSAGSFSLFFFHGDNFLLFFFDLSHMIRGYHFSIKLICKERNEACGKSTERNVTNYI